MGHAAYVGLVVSALSCLSVADHGDGATAVTKSVVVCAYLIGVIRYAQVFAGLSEG